VKAVNLIGCDTVKKGGHMKKTVAVLIALVLCIPVITFAADVTLTSDGNMLPGTRGSLSVCKYRVWAVWK
jgi:hypothetical protein